ncbi:hypothetical protein HPP92_011327 [Vanilla planifolia]|uniref:Ribosome biogenesis protein slx9-like n=1 Tax=Vanilla planifolia TaxID=51239 RepID=A0A835U741_VANPL|nr:hypothetical protein HPP92_026144 [Vanilla planifolia]KAG0483243.1 hypothetical protein HPP92_011327 [Vanilla planifolia]
MGLTGLRRSTGRKELPKSSKRKIEKKLNFITKISEAVSSLRAKKAIGKKKRLRSRKKKLKAYDLGVLADFLPDPDSFKKLSAKPTDLKLNCKNRLKLLQKESQQLSAVHSHPLFQADPISAIQLHLEQTQPPIEEEKKPNKGKRDKRKKAKSAGLRNMDISC